MTGKIKKEIISWLKTISVSMLLVFSITLFIKPTIVNGESMYPTLNNNDYLIVNKLSYIKQAPKRGDMLVFKTGLIDNKTNKKKDLVKRVIALPGEHIIIKDGEVFIDGKKLNEEYLHGVTTDGNIDMIVPQNHIFTMGDNRPKSGDSREIGAINIDDVIGKVDIRLYPFNKIVTVK
ncbi:signal peptidase I [Paraclostridium ghonii]|uniref:Signal peptidase I n=1 Tax=Paraclostridium ghonii TaxID=29358 RepID=A0ABU0MZH7_9FIRM|nr:signal peptidase I [Paeniclostridium ghonii]MDQ0556009.1 signal peptidase I [Paeniclostridium ghonii]